MITYNNLLFKYKRKLEEADISTQTGKLFLFELCNEREIDLYLKMDEDADTEIVEKFTDGMTRILNHEPMNYVLGYCWFFGYKFYVSNNVLIPRYETEELVANTLSFIDNNYGSYDKIKLIDVGTGSGAIAISLANDEPKLIVKASDISEEAISMAKRNALENNANVEFLVGSMLDPFINNNDKVDIIVSNPPYIPNKELLERSVVDFEPNVALFGGEDGLYFYNEILSKAHLILNDNGLIAFEMGYNQSDKLVEMAKSYFPGSKIEVIKDINAKDRMLFIKL